VKVCWTDQALGHLDGIHDYIARNSEIYARRMVDRLTGRSKQIGRYPHSGRMVPEYHNVEIREVIEGPYRVIYKIKPEQIDIVAVLHSARLLPPNPPG
jgi:toxin ParE1/3/4